MCFATRHKKHWFRAGYESPVIYYRRACFLEANHFILYLPRMDMANNTWRNTGSSSQSLVVRMYRGVNMIVIICSSTVELVAGRDDNQYTAVVVFAPRKEIKNKSAYCTSS